jgi:hypothetical protein
MSEPPASLSRPRRNLAATEAKIAASLKAQDGQIGHQEEDNVKSERKVKQQAERTRAKVKSEHKVKSEPSATVKSEPSAKRKAKAPDNSKSKKRKAAPESDDDDSGEQLLGHFISRCVGIQWYSGNGVRYNKEILRLKRDPHNRYDPKAVAVWTGDGKRQVGHVQASASNDARAVSAVADDASLKGRIRMLGQVESGAGQTYKFPLRISFVGTAGARDRVAALLQRHNGIHLVAPKQRMEKKKKKKKKLASGGGASGGASSSKSGEEAPAAAAAAPADDSDDEVEFTGERTWAQRDAELRAQAVVLE